MRKMAMVFFTFWSLTAFASVGLFSEMHAAGTGPMHFKGSGTYYKAMQDMRGKYLGALTITRLDSDNGKNRAYFDWHLVLDDGMAITYGLILEGSSGSELLTVYVPASADTQHDLSSYVRAGYGYVAGGDGVSGGKELIFFNCLYTNGSRYDVHMVAEEDDEGNIVISSNGTIGNDKDGMLQIWTDSYRHL